MKTLTRHLQARIAKRFLLLALIFLAVLVGGQLGALINRGAPPETLGPVALFMVLFALPVALPMALASAVLVVLGEMRRDGELQALATAGIDPAATAQRAWPFVLVGVLASVALWHAVMPAASRGVRHYSAQIAQAMVAQRVANMQPIWDGDQVSAWAGSVEGRDLKNLFVVRHDQDSFTAVFAPSAGWDIAPGGIRFDLREVRLVHRRGDQLAVAEAPGWSAVINPARPASVGKGGNQREPDTMSTRRAWATMRTEAAAGRDRGSDCSQYNNARFTLHVRFWMPLALVCYCLFAAGLAVAFGAAESLVAVGIVVGVVAVSSLPAFGYVKSNVGREQFDPGILLWLPGLTLAFLGWAMLRWPERARDLAVAPMWYMRMRVVEPLLRLLGRGRR